MMPKYEVNYRGEFSTIVEAKDEDEAIDKSMHKKWKAVGNLWSEYFEVKRVGK